MVIGDILMFTVYGTNLNEAWQQVYFYRVHSIAAYSDAESFSKVAAWYLNWWELNVWDAMDSVTTTQANVQGCKVRNLFSLGNVGEDILPAPVPGVNAGTPAAPFITYKLKQPLGRAGMRPGFKSFPGVVETCMGVGGLLENDAITALQGAAAALSLLLNVLDFDEVFDFEMIPVIIKRYRTGAGTPASPYVYRLPETQAELGVNRYVAQAWAPVPYVSTMNSRKYGRGD